MRAGLKRLDDPGTSTSVEAPRAADIRQLEVGELLVDLRSHEVRRDGTPVHLSPTEYKLLVALASRPGEALDYTHLAQLGLGYETEAWEAKELVKRHIFAMRHKIERDPASPRYILNVRGVGYRLASPIGNQPVQAFY